VFVCVCVCVCGLVNVKLRKDCITSILFLILKTVMKEPFTENVYRCLLFGRTVGVCDEFHGRSLDTVNRVHCLHCE